jgi:hypothetical protein
MDEINFLLLSKRTEFFFRDLKNSATNKLEKRGRIYAAFLLMPPKPGLRVQENSSGLDMSGWFPNISQSSHEKEMKKKSLGYPACDCLKGSGN